MPKFIQADRLRLAAAGLLATALVASPALANIVQNGSFETLTGPFVDIGGNYMDLSAGSPQLAGWTITTSSGNISLGKTITGDGFSAANGTYFIDLSGLSAESFDGAVSQTIGAVGGVTYDFSMDLATANDPGAIFASVGGQKLSLNAGTNFTVGDTSWTTWTATFTGGAGDSSAILTIGDGVPGSTIDFVDNVIINPAGAAVPEPSAWALLLLGFVGAGMSLRRRAAQAT